MTVAFLWAGQKFYSLSLCKENIFEQILVWAFEMQKYSLFIVSLSFLLFWSPFIEPFLSSLDKSITTNRSKRNRPFIGFRSFPFPMTDWIWLKSFELDQNYENDEHYPVYDQNYIMAIWIQLQNKNIFNYPGYPNRVTTPSISLPSKHGRTRYLLVRIYSYVSKNVKIFLQLSINSPFCK